MLTAFDGLTSATRGSRNPCRCQSCWAMNVCMPGTVNASWPCSGAYSRPFLMTDDFVAGDGQVRDASLAHGGGQVGDGHRTSAAELTHDPEHLSLGGCGTLPPGPVQALINLPSRVVTAHVTWERQHVVDLVRRRVRCGSARCRWVWWGLPRPGPGTPVGRVQRRRPEPSSVRGPARGDEVSAGGRTPASGARPSRHPRRSRPQPDRSARTSSAVMAPSEAV